MKDGMFLDETITAHYSLTIAVKGTVSPGFRILRTPLSPPRYLHQDQPRLAAVLTIVRIRSLPLYRGLDGLLYAGHLYGHPQMLAVRLWPTAHYNRKHPLHRRSPGYL